ncbi:hypothetical protein [Devosia sp. 1566]|uniref:GFA family protein n=1 Tax=Devosia sp. 1566 TaxID=2499144 RepID=UPI000FDACAAB|nr:hypothetical protein [Devosia sp. 1566]
MKEINEIGCRCGQVRLVLSGAPIISTECCCSSCRQAGARLEQLEGAAPILGEHGTTRFVLYRKDRVTFLGGLDGLREFRLSPDAGTRRVVATCCNTPVFLDFKGGHWFSLYAGLWPQEALPPVEMRTMTSDLPDPSVLPGDVPNRKHQSVSFFAKLLGAWMAMGFRSPYLPVGGKLEA